MSNIKNLRSHIGVKISENLGKGNIDIKKKLSFNWKALNIAFLQDLDVSNACFNETRLALSTKYQKWGGFLDLKFSNLNKFTGASYGVLFNPYTHLELFAWTKQYFEEESSLSIVGLAYKNSDKFGITAAFDFLGEVHLQTNWRLLKSTTLICSSTIRPNIDERPIDLGVTIKFEC